MKIPTPTEREIARFWSRITQEGPESEHDGTCCWIPIADIITRPQMNIGGKTIRMYYLGYYIKYGQWPPEGTQLNHHCDNGYCVNPDHMWAGTQLENIADMFKKGRARSFDYDKRGHRNNQAQLSEQQVVEIRGLWDSRSLTKTQIAVKFGCTRQNIRLIVTRQSWTHIP